MDSIKLVKNLLKTKMQSKSEILKPGNLCIFRYNAKDKTAVFDRTPLCLVLRTSRSYMLGINFHWCPIPMRQLLMTGIFKLNKKQVLNNEPLKIEWNQIRPMLNKLGFYPIIRLYIIKRISNTGVKIPNQNLKQIITTKSSTFIGADENVLYRQAVRNFKSKK